MLCDVGKLMGAGRRSGGGAAPSPVPFAFEAEAQAIFDAMTASGSSASARRKGTINRCVKRMKARGIWSKMTGLYFLGDTEGHWLINWKSPGTFDLTKNGAPTFSAANGVSSGGNVSNFYDTNIPLSSRDQNSVSLGYLATVGGTMSSSVEMGARDGTAGIVLAGFNTAGNVNSRLMDTGPTLTGTFSSPGFRAISRINGTTVNAYNYGLNQANGAAASVASVSAATITVLKDKGGTTSTARTLGMAFVGTGLTDAEMADLSAISNQTLNLIRFGEALYQEVGIGDAAITTDVAVYGTSLAGVIAAIELKRQGKTVCLVGDYLAKYTTDIGGHPANGLAWIDTKSLTAVSGLFRSLITQCNTFRSVTDSSDQGGMSIYPLIWNWACLRALDPARTGGTVDGADIPVYFTGGVTGVTKVDNGDGSFKITQLKTADGRTFSASVIIGADYDGDILNLAGIPYTKGAEAAGASNESINGFDPTRIAKPYDGTSTFNLDPYVTPATPASGLLPDVIEMPALSAGAADPILQVINFRMAVTNVASIKAPLTGGVALAAPAGYTAARYERLGRLLAASTAAGHTMDISHLFSIQSPISQNTGRGDMNNGDCQISTDLPQSGAAYLQAADYAARRAVVADIKAYMQGFFYWLLQSGDSRIPAALKTQVQGYGLSADHFLDGDTLYWPNLPYLRDPVYQMNNSGLRLSANGVWAVDGTTPASQKTISVAAYNADRHAPRMVAYDDGGGAGKILWAQGGYGIDVGLGGPCGANNRSPVAMEVIMPDKAVCTNYLTPTHYSATKVAHSVFRMEFTLGLAAQGCALIADLAIDGGIAVQDVNYTTLRAAFLAVPDAVTPVLPQLN